MNEQQISEKSSKIIRKISILEDELSQIPLFTRRKSKEKIKHQIRQLNLELLEL